MRHTTVFDTPQPLIYHICTALKLKVCILCHITSYTTPSASFNFDQSLPRYCFQMQLQNKHRQYEAHDRLRYTQPLKYHICTAFKPKVCILCHITSYTTPSASFNFDQTLPRYCFQMQLQNKHRQYEAHDRLRYTPAPYIPHMYSFEAKSMHFMSYNFLYDPSASFNFDQTSPRYCFLMQLQNKHRQYEAHDRLRYTPAPYIPHMYSFKAKSMHFMSYNYLYDPLSLFQFRSNFTKVLLLDVASK